MALAAATLERLGATPTGSEPDCMPSSADPDQLMRIVLQMKPFAPEIA
jgi:hypothetical protein